jgi:hypothetical protein
VMAGNGTIGLEILEDLPDPDAIVIPYGGARIEQMTRENRAGLPEYPGRTSGTRAAAFALRAE